MSMQFSDPIMHWEDFEPGMVFELGDRSVSAEDIVRVAKEFDPQVFHVDPDAARDTFFAGLVASGWHTVGIFLNMYVTGLLRRTANIAGLGIDDLRYFEPVRPGDKLVGRARVGSVRPSTTRPEAGVVVMRWEMMRDDGVVVMEANCPSLVRRRF